MVPASVAKFGRSLGQNVNMSARAVLVCAGGLGNCCLDLSGM